MLGLNELSSDCIHFLSYPHSVAKTMHGRIYGRFNEREKKKKHLREETRKFSRMSGNIKGQIDVNSHKFKGSESPCMCVFLWICGYRQSHASSKFNAYQTALTTERGQWPLKM